MDNLTRIGIFIYYKRKKVAQLSHLLILLKIKSPIRIRKFNSNRNIIYINICFFNILTGKLNILVDRITVTTIVVITYTIKPNENEL